MFLTARFKKGVAAGALAVMVLGAATPALASGWWQGDYSYRTKINVNAQGAGVTADVNRAPVLVRLHTGNFDFADVKKDGSDLRFVAATTARPWPSTSRSGRRMSSRPWSGSMCRV
ncbi:hypothetical protein [Brevundimonas nasdae]|uniref:Lipid/polyisoprenoid-binding YceI-like domain-containing protein n=1 Tax=Brevundimonas nasdae TaxID=172043 RepID=A0ABX8THI8_9CAUL|nr:hypothetical protein [Brevundimonas nasdae]QYC10696.1 hypothetical protein KWG56_01360 [Brevundimonas nasdae]QYC13483.1 hypothetical protein KWG63_14915 [Brevundimonas nasdae]